MSSEQTKPYDLEQLRERLQVAPFHRWLGINLVTLTRDELILEMPWRDEIVSNPKIASAHGGVLSALIDLTGLYTILAFGGTARATIDLHVDFHRPATPGALRAIGRPVKIGRQMSVAATRIVSGDGALLASGRGAYVGG
ncbi:MAG: hotdog fold thioesterase [Bradyrhizobium sp.]|uniref:hotdog fold thioesterase n=1 Tax=Bradyrhizobium TaxID=374 RepID=UPI000401951F|nr:MULTISPECIES: hotdog fold thioesterase [Bradyrhizobium]MBJ7403757.1 hotdog fold thioesterase [Bradyrhizobium sp.]